MRSLQQTTFHCVTLAVMATWVAGARAAEGFRGADTTAFRHDTTETPLRLPTAVAIGPSGNVFVLDGVHDRILEFRPDATILREIHAFGDQKFDQPVGLRATSDGRLWLADSGNGRVLVGTPDGGHVRTIDLPPVEGGRSDPTDVAVTPDGAAVWIVDNDQHRLVRSDVRSGTVEVHGKLGLALGQFEYPFQIATLRNGDIVVSDVINARLQLLSAAGAPLRSIGSPGVDPGQFFRPGGVAVDAEDRIWAADSIMGVVQVFRSDGSLIDVLRGADDQPLHFDAPLGLAFDRDGALYVVESNGNRVRKLAIEKTSRPNPPAAPPRPNSQSSGQQSKACTICHIDWLPAFADGRDSSLMVRPLGTKDDPVAARSEMCLSCHDGAVADSRRRVWEEHGHRTGVAPPASMAVPAHLPLIDGKLACRTCHSAHGSDVPQGDFRRAMLLRVPNPASELCISCHVDKTRGPRFGTHPTGGMPWAIPEKLLAAGAKMGPNPRELTCQVCHTPHGAKNDHLLVLGTSTNQLCATCHDAMRPGMFRDGAHAEHPLTAKLNPEQLAAIRDMGTKTGPDGQLVCLSCHKLHHGLGQRFMLADELADGQMCLRCHSARREMVGSAHDLRTKFPEERNRLGLTPADGGPCSSCHLFHRFARATTPGPGDTAGQCLTCHQPGQCAQGKSLPAVNHPSLRCTECHNPHDARFGNFLSAKAEDLCARCHAEQSLLVGGPHDAGAAAGQWCPSADAPQDRCLACHRPHGDKEHGLFRMAPAADQPGAQGACLACHSEARPDAAGPLALRHPSGEIRSGGADADLTEMSVSHVERVDCASCHDPHRGPSAAGNLLRSARGDAADVCLGCHSDMNTIVATAHSADSLSRNKLDSAACQPCHQVHGAPDEVDPHRLWPRQLAAGPSSQPALGAGMLAVGDAYCLGCHHAGGSAPAPIIATHPDVIMTDVNPTGGPAQLPLFAATGECDPNGTIGCRTCHLPHGRSGGAEVYASHLADTGMGHPLQLRAFDVPNVCTNCHGVDALRRFLYFHDPQRRGGPLSVSR